MQKKHRRGGAENDTVPNLIDEDETSSNEGDINGEISKSFFNIESIMKRRLDRITDKNTHKVAHYTFIPELDIGLSNPMACLSKINNETFTFREMIKQPESSDFVSVMGKDISSHEINERWDIVTRTSTGNKKVLKSTLAFKRKRNPDGSLKNTRLECAPHGGVQQWGLYF